ncbi:hypothetical protein G6O69_38315 [Pseudenhygromyxa sp. WMMC2535]|nr:hypothetical protein [Pseudenhygromyxa sp. WMMC2535]
MAITRAPASCETSSRRRSCEGFSGRTIASVKPWSGGALSWRTIPAPRARALSWSCWICAALGPMSPAC